MCKLYSREVGRMDSLNDILTKYRRFLPDTKLTWNVRYDASKGSIGVKMRLLMQLSGLKQACRRSTRWY